MGSWVEKGLLKKLGPRQGFKGWRVWGLDREEEGRKHCWKGPSRITSTLVLQSLWEAPAQRME